MLKQAEEIRKERPVTPEDMANIVVNYLAQTGLNEETPELVKEVRLQMLEGAELS